MTTEAVIVGIGETKVGRHPDRSGVELQAEAVRLAVADAGMSKNDIDAVHAHGSYNQPALMHAATVSEYLGLKPRFQGNFDIGGTPTYIGMAFAAIAAIEQGQYETAVCVFGDNAASRRAPGSHGVTRRRSETGAGEDFEEPYGQTVLISYALLARRYLDVHKLDPETAFFPVAAAMRQNASLNDNAVFRKPITLEDYRKSEFIAEPLRKLDCSPVADGAGAFVITSKEKARKLASRHPWVSVLGSGMQMTHKMVSQIPELNELGMAPAGRQAFAQAGLSVKDVDTVTVHDAFTISVLLSLEELGFYKPGEACKHAAAGEISVGGALPTNTHGGLLSQGHISGVLHVVEAIRQLRGEAGQRQVADAEIALVAGNMGVFSMCGAMLLGKGS
jgi:acetyl-CoA acetyltransferase